jgi:hypothetical protein
MRDLLYAVKISKSITGNDQYYLVPYFPAYLTHRPIGCTAIFSLEILEKNNDECILILVIYWKKTGLLHTKLATII